MKAWRTIRTKFQPGIFLPVLGVCVVLNFAYHFVQGDGGIRALLDYQNRIEKTRLQLDQIRSERKQLEHRVYLLRSDSLDPDMLEERARAVLNFAEPNEFAIIIEQDDNVMTATSLPNPPYYAVIFVNQRTPDDHEGYGQMAERMVELAQQQPGYLGMESVRETSGKGITVSYWRDEEAIAQWKNNIEHIEARKLGKKMWYEDYQLQIAKIEHGYRWIKNQITLNFLS